MSYQLNVHCDGRVLRDTLEPSHAGKRAHIARLEFVAAGEKRYAVQSGPLAEQVHDRDMWTPHPVSRRRYSKLRRAGIDDAEEALVCEFIGADGSVIPESSLADRDSDWGEVHMKVVMRCPLCHLDLQARIDKISPYLDDLRHAGWGDVSLASLAAIVGK